VKSKKEASKPGPKADVLVGQGDWESAVKTALARKRPPAGWPKPTATKRAPKK